MKTFLLFAFILSNLYLTFADWEHPHYSYRCLENGDVEFFGVHEKSTIKVETTESECKCTHDKTSHFYLIKSCLTNNYNATISVYDFDFDGVSEAPPTTESSTGPNIIGGHRGHQFVITCEDIPPEGINKTVAHVFQGSNYNQLPKNYKEVASVEMRFKAVNNTKAPDITTVYIGDEFYMFIKYMGKEKYTVIPEECAAYGEAWIPKGYETTPAMNWVELWNIHNYKNSSDSKGCANHEELLEKFGRYNKTFIYAKMYGFRFANKNYITITCQVRIFDNPHTSVTKDLCMDIKTLTGRRKRNIENVPFQRKTLTKKLWVLDNENVQLDGNNGLQIKWETSLWIMIFATITFNFWLADY